MSLIPQHVIDNWRRRYSDENSELRQKYGLDELFINKLNSRLNKDHKIIEDIAFGTALPVQSFPDKCPEYIATAGAPGAGKSTLLEQVIAASEPKYFNYVRVDPDRWGMKAMVHTYHLFLISTSELSKALTKRDGFVKAYDIARPASNYMTLEFLNRAFRQHYNIVHGTTSTGEHVEDIAKTLKSGGYNIHYLLVGAPLGVRRGSHTHREEQERYFQSDWGEGQKRNRTFAERMFIYFQYGDRIDIYWRYAVEKDAVHAARLEKGRFVEHDRAALMAFIDQYHRDRQALIDEEPGHENLLPPFQRLVSQAVPTNNLAPQKGPLTQHATLKR